jgi:hypothetical protein
MDVFLEVTRTHPERAGSRQAAARMCGWTAGTPPRFATSPARARPYSDPDRNGPDFETSLDSAREHDAHRIVQAELESPRRRPWPYSASHSWYPAP